MNKSNRYFILLISPCVIFFLVFVAYPLALLVFSSFYDVNLMSLNDRIFIGINNYIKTLTSASVINSASKTLQYTIITLSLEFSLGFGMALAFYALNKKISEILMTIFLFPLMVAPIVAGLLWKFMLIDNFGIVNWILEQIGIIKNAGAIAWLSNPDLALYSVSIADIWLTSSFVTLVLFAGLKNISPELLEVAKIDGANGFHIFRYIILPLLRPIIAVVLIIRGLDATRTFDAIWIMTQGGPQYSTDVLSLRIYRTMIRYGYLGKAASMATLFSFALLIFSLITYQGIWRQDTNK